MAVFLRIGIALALLGAAAITGGVLLGRSLSDPTGKQFVEGDVVRLRGHSTGRGRAPVVSYRADGIEYEIASNSYSKPPAYSIGERVRISYRPDSPERGRINSFRENWLWPIIIMIAGGIAATIGVVFSWFSISDLWANRLATPQSDGDLDDLHALLESDC